MSAPVRASCGVEKVVARDGLKAVLTLRLAPILPIPIGLYNYVYGVTNVPIGQFAGGIFLGSLKPYLLDSYLGYFGKEPEDLTISESASIVACLKNPQRISPLNDLKENQANPTRWVDT